MRLIFLGSPEPVLAPLAALLDEGPQHGHELVGVVSQPAKPVGRRGELTDPPVAAFAKARGIPSLQPVKASDPAFLDALRALAPDVCITAAYGQILTDDFLKIPRRGTINIHPSLLPRYRGATPVPAALLDGERESGVTILFTVRALDAGAIIVREHTMIAPEDTAGSLTKRYFELGAKLLFPALERLSNPMFSGEPQDEARVTHCRKIKKTDGLIDWMRPAVETVNRFRAFEPWPGSYTFQAGRRLALSAVTLDPDRRAPMPPGTVAFDKAHGALLVGTGTEPVLVRRLKPAGGKEIDAAAFWNGLKDKAGVTFTASEVS